MYRQAPNKFFSNFLVIKKKRHTSVIYQTSIIEMWKVHRIAPVFSAKSSTRDIYLPGTCKRYLREKQREHRERMLLALLLYKKVKGEEQYCNAHKLAKGINTVGWWVVSSALLLHSKTTTMPSCLHLLSSTSILYSTNILVFSSEAMSSCYIALLRELYYIWNLYSSAKHTRSYENIVACFTLE